MRRNLLSTLTALALLLGGGCSRDEAPDAASSAEGRIEFQAEISAEVTQQTRAQVTLPSNYRPSSVSNFKLIIKGKENTSTSEILMEYPAFSDYNTPFMDSGAYTATISYGDPEAEGPSKFCYAGTVDFEVIARKTTHTTITAGLSNAAISLSCGEWFNKYYTDANFVIRTESGNSFSFPQNSSASAPIFVKPATRLFLKGTAVKAQNGVKVEFPEYEIGTTAARSWHKIVIDASQVGEKILLILLDDTLTEVAPVEVELNPEA